MNIQPNMLIVTQEGAPRDFGSCWRPGVRVRLENRRIEPAAGLESGTP
jgi:hypothetical protein